MSASDVVARTVIDFVSLDVAWLAVAANVATTDVAPADPGVQLHVATPADSATDAHPLIVEPPAVKAMLPVVDGVSVAVRVTADPTVGEAEFVSASVVAARTVIDFVSLDPRDAASGV